ncbi:hypothetical protein [Paenibacillus sp. NPDC057967]|uniref:hypothetical protein n=1 Tax=Paenibacillus sp. NPDC057967 TaxID=3346293 RepID=UPI0036DC645A
MKMKRIFKTVLLASMILIFANTNISAYVLYPHGYHSPSMTFKNVNLNSLYSTALINAAASWMVGTPASVFLQQDSSSTNTIVAGNYGQSWYGYYQPYTLNSSGEATRFEIRINGDRIAEDLLNGVTIVNTPQSAFAHEFGHALHLDDLSSGSAIMNNNRNREYYFKPTKDDIDGVKAYW